MHYFCYPLRVLLGLLLRRPILGACVIPILPSGEIVLVRRKDSGLWGLPGGIVDWGETVLAAAQRELYEETGLTFTGLDRLVGVYSAPGRDPRFHSVCVAIALHVEGIPQVADSRELLEIKAFAADNLPHTRLSHDHLRQLEDYFQGATVLA